MHAALQEPAVKTKQKWAFDLRVCVVEKG